MSHDDASNRTTSAPVRSVTGWGTAVRLAIVVSIASALVVAAFHGRVTDSTLICGVIFIGSVAGWLSAEHAPTPAPVRLRRR